MKLKKAFHGYLESKRFASGTEEHYSRTLKKLKRWGKSPKLHKFDRSTLADFFSWVHEQAKTDGGRNPGRTSNQCREHLHAVFSWAYDVGHIDAVPRFPKEMEQRTVSGKHYLSMEQVNALYWATHRLKRPRLWKQPIPVGAYWRTALVLLFNYGLDTGSIWKSKPSHQPILWRHVSWDAQSPDPEVSQSCDHGWIYYRRVKTQKSFYRPMNPVIASHIKSLETESSEADDPIFHGGGTRPTDRFERLCELAKVDPKRDSETGEILKWVIKDLRKTCATYHDLHIPESSIEILGHSVGGITYRHYAHRAPLAYRAITGLPQPEAFYSLEHEGGCPCCHRKFDQSAA